MTCTRWSPGSGLRAPGRPDPGRGAAGLLRPSCSSRRAGGATNAVRHAPGAAVTVTVVHRRQVLVRVVDDGDGPGAAAPAATGWSGSPTSGPRPRHARRPGPAPAVASPCRPSSDASRGGAVVTIRVLVVDDRAPARRAGHRAGERPSHRGGRPGTRRADAVSLAMELARRRPDGCRDARRRRDHGDRPLRERAPSVRCLVLTMFDLDDYVVEACAPARQASCSRPQTLRS